MTICPRSWVNCFILSSSAVVTLPLVSSLRASFTQEVWQAWDHPYLSRRASGNNRPCALPGLQGGPATVSCIIRFLGANTTSLSWSGGTGWLCPGVGGKTDVEAGAGTGVTLVSSQSYSRPLLTPEMSPGAAQPQLGQRRRQLCPHAQPGPGNLRGENFAICPLGSTQRAPEIPVPPTPLTLETGFSEVILQPTVLLRHPAVWTYGHNHMNFTAVGHHC